MADGAIIDVSGDLGGGNVNIGGGFQGSNPDIPNAEFTYVGTDVAINADARTNGDGGQVIIWAEEVARVFGDISARGGAISGDGGFVETSGKGYLDFNGSVDASASNGAAGTRQPFGWRGCP